MSSQTTSSTYSALDVNAVYSGITMPLTWSHSINRQDEIVFTPLVWIRVYVEGEFRFIQIDPTQAWWWSQEWQAGEQRVNEYLQRGKIEEFDSMDEFIATLDD